MLTGIYEICFVFFVYERLDLKVLYPKKKPNQIKKIKQVTIVESIQHIPYGYTHSIHHKEWNSLTFSTYPLYRESIKSKKAFCRVLCVCSRSINIQGKKRELNKTRDKSSFHSNMDKAGQNALVVENDGMEFIRTNKHGVIWK